MLKGFITALLLLGVSSQVLAWDIKVSNKTPYGIMAKAKSWKGLLHGNWVTIPAGQSAKVGPKGADCIAGMWVKVNMPNEGYKELGYFGFKFSPMSPCSNTAAVVGVEPVISYAAAHGPSMTGTIGVTRAELKSLNSMLAMSMVMQTMLLHQRISIFKDNRFKVI
jgi:hypothetical protein